MILLSHRKEILEQDAAEIQSMLPFGHTCGIYSAGLRRYAMDDSVICAGVQSVYKKWADFGRRHLVIIDEAHLLNDDDDSTMYRQFIDGLTSVNPKMRLIGLSATPYRTATGTICGPDKLFHSICYEAKIPQLIADGYLCPLVNKPTGELFDTSKLHIRAGEFIANEVERLFNDNGKTEAACIEMVAATSDRHTVLVFTSGVAHAQHVAACLQRITGKHVGCVTGETSPLERAAELKSFAEMRTKFLVNVDCFTTGLNVRCIDTIVVLRATASAGLFCQIAGRGFRTHDSKKDCLILDHGGNLARHGPLDSPSYGQKKVTVAIEREPSEPIEGGKQCPACNAWVSNATKVCECGWLFANIDTFSDSQSQILAKPEKWFVTKMYFSRHVKRKAKEDAPNTLRVTYAVEPYCSEPIAGNLATKEISEWVCLEHEGWAKTNALQWWRKHSIADLNEDGFDWPIDAAVSLFERGAVANVLSITTMRDGHFYKIINREIDERPQEWLPLEDEPEPIGYDEWGQPVYSTIDPADIPF